MNVLPCLQWKTDFNSQRLSNRVFFETIFAILFFDRYNLSHKVHHRATHSINLLRPAWGGGEGLLRPTLTLKMYNFKTIKPITTKLGDFPEMAPGGSFQLISLHEFFR